MRERATVAAVEQQQLLHNPCYLNEVATLLAKEGASGPVVSSEEAF